MNVADQQTQKQLLEIMGDCYGDMALAAKTFLPDRFFRDFDAGLHGRMFDLLENSDNPRKVIAAPRGVGKTSIINFLIPFLRILYQDAHYIVPVSATTSLAMQQSENLKQELVANPFVNAAYGDIKTDNFSKQQWVANTGAVSTAGHDLGSCVMPRGAGSQIRGLLYRGRRPGLILVDDLETTEGTMSEEQREKLEHWFFSDLMNSVDRGLGGQWEVIVLGTVLHQSALLVKLLNNSDWDDLTLRICDDDLKSTAPNFIPDSEVKKLYNRYKNAGKLDAFYREYWNSPVPLGDDAAFPRDYFQHYDPASMRFKGNPNIDTIVFVDPARSVNPSSAETAIVGVSVDINSEAIYVRDVVNKKLHPTQIYDEIAKMATNLDAGLIVVEDTGLKEFITYPLTNELLRRGIFTEVMPVHARGGANEKGKTSRVRSLVPFYRAGLVYHNPSCCAALEEQLMSFPYSDKWDIMDALSYLPQVLETGERYMGRGSYAPNETEREVEAEYREIEDMDFAEPEWNGWI